jgi:ATP-binding cassette, subfamily F, member 3
MPMPTQKKAVLTVNAISKNYELLPILKDVTFTVFKGEKIGLVGSNGSGKSTLLKIIQGIISPDTGSIEHSPKLRSGYIPQTFASEGETSVSNFLEGRAGISTAKDMNVILSTFEELKLSRTVLNRKINELSGGEKTKLALAGIFLDNHDIVLLDEPTNNLDLHSLGILERYVKESNKTFIIVSHDRRFLDTTVTRIVELDDESRTSRVYDGNFSDYMEERRKLIELHWKKYSDSQEEINRLEKEIDEKEKKAHVLEVRKDKRDNDKMLSNFKREHAQKKYHKAGNVLKDRLDKLDKVEKPKSILPLKIYFDIEKRSGDRVFSLKKVVKQMGSKTLGPIDLSISYGDRVLIIGENGSGKTTLLKMLLGTIVPDEGEIIKNETLSIGYLPQEEHFGINTTLIDEFLKHVEIEEGDARKVLHRFRLTTDDVHKKIKDLSSGERSRLILAITMAKKVNCLVLDEPSNHLDLEATEKFEGALKEYEGTLIVVSHDRYFIDKIGINSTYILENGTLRNIVDYNSQ